MKKILNTFKFACKTFALVCKHIMLPQETLRSLAKVLRSFVNSTAFPQETLYCSQNVAFSHKN